MTHRKKTQGGNSLAAGPAEAGLQVRGRVWVEKDGLTFLSWGRVALLERIGEHGSVSAAARSMGMGYRHAWSLVEDMNRLAGQSLVEKKAGGAGGGGARLTPAGRRAIDDFWELVNDFQEWMTGRPAPSGGN